MCIVRFSPTGQVQDFNPVQADTLDNLWVFGNGFVRDLGFDPKEWDWRKIGSLKVGNFFSYETKKGYSLIIQSQYRQLNFDMWLERLGYSIQQRRMFFRKLWHQWTPRKICSMIWLVIAEGIPIGSWRMCIGYSRICPLCTQNTI
jgi:hypothetical protein